MPSLYNAVAGTRLARKAAALAGIDPRRSLPRVANRTFSKRFPELPQGTGPGGGRPLQRHLERVPAARGRGGGREALRRRGGEGALPEVVCCGRPMLSEGLVDEARKNAKRNLDLLTPLVERGVPLVGLEPSCILTMRDDYRKLLPEDERVESWPKPPASSRRRCSNSTWSFPCEKANPVLLHGHCHQKALVGTGPTERLLGLAADVEVVDSGCCGMAGLFGYEKGHYEVSMQMGERRLFPAVREAGERVVVAPGTSCREQILDGTERRALHPAEYLASLLDGTSGWLSGRKRCGSPSGATGCSCFEDAPVRVPLAGGPE